MDANIAQASELVRAARDAGADLIALPETVALMEPKGSVIRETAVSQEEHPALVAFSALALDVGAWLLVGSVAVRAVDGRLANRSILLDDKGRTVATYDKIHMFDVDIPNGESHRESAIYRPGDAACLVETPWGLMGMTVCYDLRFPHLYRALAHAGARFLTVPSAFTEVTGRAHWHVLLRARAIETGCFVIAPGQSGSHPGNRRTYGHSLIVDPWGEVLADAGQEIGFITAEIDPAKVDEARAAIPALGHDRPFRAPRGRASTQTSHARRGAARRRA